MKTIKLIFVIGIIALIAACTKQDLVEPESATIPGLKTSGCTPSVLNYYSEDDSIYFAFLPAACFNDLVLVNSSYTITSGHLVTAASCRFNNKGSIQIQLTGVGLSGDIYEANITNEYHMIGSVTGQGAQVTHVIDEAVFTNTTTMATYTTTMILKQTINGNGEVVIDEWTFVPCE